MNFKKKLGLLSATVLAAGFGMAPAALAQDEDVVRVAQAEEEEEADEEEEIVVTGSRLPQTAFTSAAPVGVITAEEATLEGLANTADIIQQTPATGGAFQINTQLTGFVTTGGPGVNTISLRGLGAERTLVLLNGRRIGPAGTRGTVGPVDLNVIPSSLISRIEILKDGASSIYGSDAVAGVVNFITRTDLDGIQINAFTNFNEDGGGEQHRLNASWGTTWTGGYFNIGGEYFEQEVLRNRDRDDTACASDYLFDPVTGARVDYPNVDPGQEYPDDTYKCYNLFTRVVRANFGAGSMDLIWEDPGVNYAVPGNNSPVPGMARQNRVGFPDTFPYGHMDAPAYGRSSAISPFELTSLVANLGFDVGQFGEFYAELMANRRESIQYGARQFFPQVHPSNPGDTIGIPLISLFIPIIPLSSDRDQTVDYYRGVAGIRGDFGNSGWDWDFHIQASRSDAEYGTDIIYNDRVLATTWVLGCDQAELDAGPSGGQCADLAAPIPWTDPRILNGDFNDNERAFLFDHEYGTTTYDQQLAEFVVSGTAFELPAGPIAIAAGVSYRHEELDDTPGFNERNFNLWGSTSAGRTAGEDNVSELFAEIGVPVVRDLPLVESFDISASARYVEYDSYGEGDTYKIGINWVVTPDIRIRATQGTSFRAPQLYELFLANQTSFLGQASIDPCITWENDVPIVGQNCAADGVPMGYTAAGTSSATIITGGGAGILRAEESEASTVGIIFTPRGTGLSFAVDYFDILVEDEITRFGAGNILRACYTSNDGPAFGGADPFCTLFVRNPGVNPPGGAGPNAIQEVTNSYVNVAHQGNRGIDITMRYDTPFAGGDLTLSAEVTHMLEDVVQIFQAGLVDDFLGTTQTFRGPDLVGRASVRWDYNDWTGVWNINYIGPGSDDEQFGGDVFFSSRYQQNVRFQQSTEEIIYHDLSLRRQWENMSGVDVSLVLGVNNIFDERPPGQSTGQFRRGTAALNAYDLVGRRAFVNLALGF